MDKLYYRTLFIFSVFSINLHSQVIYNAYAKVTTVAGTLLSVNNVNQVNHTFNVSDMVIVMQMQDDAIGSNTTNIASFGDLATIKSAGIFEVAQISAVNLSAGTPTSIALSAPLVNTYNTGANSSVQIISFRKLSAAAFTTTNSIAGLPWNGNIGGVVAFEVGTTLTLAHSISANGIGFTGGLKNTPNGYSTCDNSMYVTTIATRYAGKGEGIYKNTNTALGGARGKMLSGGGGGNDVNAGGGGGGNFTAGGDGGLGWVPAGTGCSPTAGGVGGIGLNVFINASCVYMGGGGGGGHENDGLGTPGGNGGGIILVKTGTLITTGSCSGLSITANGVSAANASNDGAGGAGAGGSIILQVNSFNVVGSCPLSVSSNGGDGGSSVTSGVHGAGGGGGQGVVIYSVAQPTLNVITNTIPGNGGSSCGGCGASVNGSPGGGPPNAAIISSSSGVLPIELISFQTVDLKENILLKWTTATEKNTDYFLIEKSKNALQWETLGKTKAAGSSIKAIDYSMYDEKPFGGISYYRLKTVDLDQLYQYSNIQSIERENDEPFMVFPNPSTGSFSIKMKHQDNQRVFIKIYDALGKLVFNDELHLNNNGLEYQFSHSLSEGVYSLKIDGIDNFNYKMVIIK